MPPLTSLFEQFLRERRYLKNVTPKTEDWYRSAFDALTRTVQIATPADLNKAALTSFIVGLRERGLSPVSCNTWAKALNAFFTWLREEGHVAECLRIQPQRTEKRILQTLTDDQLRRLVTFKPKTTAQWRAYALACTLTDSGIRIEEALGSVQAIWTSTTCFSRCGAKGGRNGWCRSRPSCGVCSFDGNGELNASGGRATGYSRRQWARA